MPHKGGFRLILQSKSHASPHTLCSAGLFFLPPLKVRPGAFSLIDAESCSVGGTGVQNHTHTHLDPPGMKNATGGISRARRRRGREVNVTAKAKEKISFNLALKAPGSVVAFIGVTYTYQREETGWGGLGWCMLGGSKHTCKYPVLTH